MSQKHDKEFIHEVPDAPPESTANGLKIIAGTTMITTAGAASSPFIVGWLWFMGADTVRSGVTGSNTVVHDAAVAAGATEGQADAVEVIASAPDVPVAVHRTLLGQSTRLVRGAYALEAEAVGKAATEVGKEVVKEVAEHPGQAAAATEQAAAGTLRAGEATATATQAARPVVTRPPNLTPGQALADDEIITVMGGNGPGRFKLQGQDFKPLEGVNQPGKSANIAIDLTPESEAAQAFGRPATKGDIVLGAQVKDIRAAGFDAVYAPTADNPLHVRIIAKEAQFTEEGSTELFQVFEQLAKKRK